MVADIENYVFDTLANIVRAGWPGAFVTGEYVRSPSKFPHVSIVEADNYMSVGRLDSSPEEKYATVMYEINVYTNDTTGKKAKAKAIIDLIDKKMYAMNFTRLSRTVVPNMEDSTIYRITARYRAETDGTTIYRV